MTFLTRGKSCRFKLADVISPERELVLLQITADIEVEGEILFLSDKGQQPNRFAIIEVEGVLSPMIVPVNKVQPAGGKEVRSQQHAKYLTPR